MHRPPVKTVLSICLLWVIATCPTALPAQQSLHEKIDSLIVADQFFGARIEFFGSETLQNPSETTRKPNLTVGRDGEGPRGLLG